MRVKKIYITDENTGYFVCEHCGFSKHFDATKFKDSNKKNVRVKCKCGVYSRLYLEFRTCYRKETTIPARCIFVKTRQSDKIRAFDVIIKDISQTGLRFEILNRKKVLLLEKNDNVILSFMLRNKKRNTPVNKDCKILNIEGNVVGVRFRDNDFEKHIGFFLMK